MPSFKEEIKTGFRQKLSNVAASSNIVTNLIQSTSLDQPLQVEFRGFRKGKLRSLSREKVIGKNTDRSIKNSTAEAIMPKIKKHEMKLNLFSAYGAPESTFL